LARKPSIQEGSRRLLGLGPQDHSRTRALVRTYEAFLEDWLRTGGEDRISGDPVPRSHDRTASSACASTFDTHDGMRLGVPLLLESSWRKRK